MAVAETSRFAIGKVNVSKNEAAVYRVVQINEPLTNERIADILGWEQFKVTGRTNALVKKNLLRILDKSGKTRSGNPAQRYVVHTQGDDIIANMLKEEREQEREWRPAATSWIND